MKIRKMIGLSTLQLVMTLENPWLCLLENSLDEKWESMLKQLLSAELAKKLGECLEVMWAQDLVAKLE